MNIFIVAFLNAIKRHFRDFTPFIMQVIGPILMILILGSALKGNFSSDTFMKPLKVAIINQDSGNISKQFVSFLSSEKLSKFMKVNLVSDLETTKQMLRENKYDGVIYIKSNYSKEYRLGNYDQLQTFLIKSDKTTYQILSSVLNGWKNNSSAIKISLKNGSGLDKITAALLNSDKLIIEKSLLKNGKLPKAIDYYAVTMVIMTLVYTGVLAMGKLQVDFLSEMKTRFHNAPVNIGIILTGALMGTTLLGFLQSVAVVLFTHFAYGVNWGTNFVIVGGVLLLMTLFGQMLAAVLTLGLKNANAPMGLIQTLGLVFTFLSGGFNTSPIGGPLGKLFLTYGTPNSLAQTAIFGSIYGGSSEIIYACMGILAAISLLFLILTIGFVKRRVL
jgi:ABC-2 type transport system permease protein